MLGTLLSRSHSALMVLCGKQAILTSPPAPADPLAVSKAVIKTLQDRATERRDMTAVGRLDAARNTIVRESLRAPR